METLSYLLMAYFVGWLAGMITMAFLVVHMIDAAAEKMKAKVKKTTVQDLNPSKWE